MHIGFETYICPRNIVTLKVINDYDMTKCSNMGKQTKFASLNAQLKSVINS